MTTVRQELRGLGVDGLLELLLSVASHHGIDPGLLLREISETSGRPAASPVDADAFPSEPYMVGASPPMQRVYDSIRRFAASNAPVLITGESGTGKELAARAIHERSAYGSGPFVVINCAALPPTLIADELFGHEKGAFTDAAQRRIGRIEAARGGTIFLDEIGDLPLEQQTHLLRFLQEHTIDRVGASHPIDVDARVIVATNVDLQLAIGQGRFRDDLFYRLNVLSLRLPSLRERGNDLELLATFFLRKFSEEQGRTIKGFSDEAWSRISTHDWPGNIRELIGCMRRAVVMADMPLITIRDLGLDSSRSTPMAAVAAPQPGMTRSRQAIDRDRLKTALSASGGNVSHAAQSLGISRTTIYRVMRRFGVA